MSIENEQKQSLISRLGSFFLQAKRVWHLLRKPSGEEFSAVAKVSAIGMLIIGLLGFLISDIIKLLK